MKKVLAMIMAGGKGERLYPLTRDRAKPAVPFGGSYRIIDFTISNCINSDIRRIYILTQYKSLSLDRHLQRAWNILNGRFGDFVYIIHAQQRINESWYRGTADAIYQNFYTLQQEKPDLVLILSGDHIYKMDYRRLINYHIRSKADLTISTMVLDKNQSRQFGVLEVDEENRVIGFQEKPARPRTVPGNPDAILTNMGIYVFNTDVLVKRLIENARKDTEHDFGKNVIPSMLNKDRVYSLPFADPRSRKSWYWRDVGTIDAYFDANMDLLRPQIGARLLDEKWPIYTSEKLAAPAKIAGFVQRNGIDYGIAHSSIIARGSVVDGGRVSHSILSPHVHVDRFAELTNCVILDNVRVGRGCRISNAIIDKGVTVPPGTVIGADPKKDARNFTVSDSGVVVIPKNTRFA